MEWVDITQHFKTAAAKLDHGELIHGPHFNLFDA